MEDYRRVPVEIKEGPLTDDELKKTIHDIQEQLHLPEQECALEIVKDLLFFEKGVCNIGWMKALTSFGRIIYSALVLAPSLISRVLIDTSGLIFLNKCDDLRGQALYGIYNTYYVVFYFCLTNSLLDKFCIDMGTAFGQKSYNKMKNIFTKAGIVCLLYLICFTLPMLIFSGPILKLLAVQEDKANDVQNYTLYSIPMVTINLLAEYLKTVCLSQGNEQVFGYSSIVTTALTIGANYYVMMIQKMGIEGLILCKTANEFVTLLIVIIVYCRTLPEARGWVAFSQVKEKFGPFFWQAMKYMFSIYPEYLGYELTTYFIVRRQDDSQSAAFFSMMNICSMAFGVGFAFSAVCRTRINILIGLKNHKAAKNYFKFFCISAFIVGALTGVGVYLAKEPLAFVFTSINESTKHWFYKLAFIYLIIAGHELVMNTVLVGMKTIGRVDLLLILNTCISMLGNLTLGYLIYEQGYNCDMQYANYMGLCTALTATCLIFTLRADWSLVHLKN